MHTAVVSGANATESPHSGGWMKVRDTGMGGVGSEMIRFHPVLRLLMLCTSSSLGAKQVEALWSRI